MDPRGSGRKGREPLGPAPPPEWQGQPGQGHQLTEARAFSVVVLPVATCLRPRVSGVTWHRWR